MSRLVAVVHWLEESFNRLGVPRSYGGAIAYNFYGPPRLTLDFDVLAVVPDLKAHAFVGALSAAACLHDDLDPTRVDSSRGPIVGGARQVHWLFPVIALSRDNWKKLFKTWSH